MDRRETGGHLHATEFTEVQWRKLVATLARVGLVTVVNGRESSRPPANSGRATSSAATAWPNGFSWMCFRSATKTEVEESACKFEHILSPDVTERICTLLGHPTACPHGSPIPKGDCCDSRRVLEPREIASVLDGIKAI